MLKTDLFEEAFGADQLLSPAPAPGLRVLGIDIDQRVASAASGRLGVDIVVADTRRLPFRDGSLSIVLSNSTLDHFDRAEDLEISIRELARTLAPGGRLLITLDNPANPLYWLLRAASRLGTTPFPLGRTAGRARLCRMVRDTGLQVISTDWLIHNPRVVSTMMFLALRKFAGAHADVFIAGLLNGFAQLGRLPTPGLTASFVAVCARKT
jgi:SAM-dependent methyltransferase